VGAVDASGPRRPGRGRPWGSDGRRVDRSAPGAGGDSAGGCPTDADLA